MNGGVVDSDGTVSLGELELHDRGVWWEEENHRTYYLLVMF